MSADTRMIMASRYIMETGLQTFFALDRQIDLGFWVSLFKHCSAVAATDGNLIKCSCHRREVSAPLNCLSVREAMED